MTALFMTQTPNYTVNNKSNPSTTTTTYNNTRRTHSKHHKEQHYHNDYCNHHRKSKDVAESDHNKNVDEFYHIKAAYEYEYEYYQATAITTQSSTLNQRTNFIYNTSSTLTTTAAATASTLSYVLHSLTYNGRSFVTMLLMGYILLVHYAMAAPQSCILCDKNDLLAKDPQTNFEEFLFEHQVTRQDAINGLRKLNDSFYEGTASDSSCNGVRCTEKVMKYCLGPQFINDHCWCEVGHSTEGLPFVPHICYVGEKIYKTSVGSCFFYEEVKDCCCSSVLAKEWRHISAGSSIYGKTPFHNNYMMAAIFYCIIFLSDHIPKNSVIC